MMCARAVVVVLAVALFGGSAISCTSSGAGEQTPADRRHSEFPFQREILNDGLVEESELERAVLAMIACLDQKGIGHSDPVYKDDESPPRWDYTIGPLATEDIGPDGAPTEADACFDQYLGDVQSAWVLQEQPTEEELHEAQEAAVQCAREAGVEAPDFQTLLGLMPTLGGEESAVVAQCLQEALG